MCSGTSHPPRPSPLPEHPVPARSPPLLPAPSLLRRGPLASLPSRRLFAQCAIPLRGNTASQSHPPPPRSPPTAPDTFPRVPFALPIRPKSWQWHFLSRQSPTTSHLI